MGNNIFSCKRFANYFSLQLSTSWKTLTLSALCIIGGIILMCTLLPYVNDTYLIPYSNPEKVQHIDRFWDTEMTIFYILFNLLATVLASLMFSAMKTKSGRIQTLTIPASPLEKYATFFIIYIAGIYILSFISLIMGDYLRVLSSHFYAHADVFIGRMPLKYLFSMGYGNFPDSTAAIDHQQLYVHYLQALYFGSILVTQAYMSLISIIWPKNSFIRGTGIAIGFTILMGVCVYLSFKMFRDMLTNAYSVRLQVLWTTVWIVTSVITLILFCISYFRFKESEVIDRW